MPVNLTTVLNATGDAVYGSQDLKHATVTNNQFKVIMIAASNLTIVEASQTILEQKITLISYKISTCC